MAKKVFEISFNIAGSLAGSFRSAFSSANKELSRLNDTTKNLKSGLRDLDRAYKNGSISASRYQSTHARLTKNMERAAQAQSRMAEAQSRRQQLQRDSSEVRGQIVDTAAVATPLVIATKTAMDFETQMLGVAKQVEGARDGNGKLTSTYYEMRDEVFKMGREMGVANGELAQLMAFSAKMGVPKNELVGFTKIVANLGEAFEMAPEEIGTSMGKLANTFSIKPSEIGGLGDIINYLDDKTLASGRGIVETMMRISGQGKALNMTEKQVAALSSTFLSLGKTEEVAGTAGVALMRELALAKEQPVRFQTAIEKLGMTSEEVSKGMATDAQSTILKVLDSIKKLDRETQTSVLTGLFGKEYGDDVAVLVGGLEEYRKHLKLVDAEEAKGSSQREADARNQTSNAQLQMLKNSGTEAAVKIGDVVLPTLNEGMSATADFTTKLADMAAKYPDATKAIVGTGAALVAARLGFLGLKFAVNTAISPLLAAKELLAKGRVNAANRAGKKSLKNIPKGPGPGGGGGTAPIPTKKAPVVQSGVPKNSAKGNVVPFPQKGAKIQATANKSLLKSSGKLAKFGGVLGKVALPLTLASEAYSIAKSNDKVKATAQSATGLAGGWGGAKVGAALGTMLAPGVGTILGGLAGGAVGYLGGKFLGGKAVDAARSSSANTQIASGAGKVETAGLDSAIKQAVAQAKIVAGNLTILASITAQSSGWVVGAFYGLQGSGQNLNSSMSILASITAQASGWMVGTFYGLQAHGMNLNSSLSILASISAQASGWVVGTFYGLQAHGMNLNSSMSILATITAQASGWMVGAIFPLTAAGNMVRGNLSILASIAGQASGWVASINGIQSGAAAVKSALNSLAARIASVPTPSVSASVGGAKPKKYARGGIARSPHVGMVAEAGYDEANIPIRKRDPRALSLWKETGRLIGAGSLFEKGGKISAASSGGDSFTYAPVISGVSEREVEPILKRERANFERDMKKYKRNKERLSFK
ncbi:phage tail tape measure protein [Domibacillus antri]|uniref:Phage tail tape measure protein n=1 Tax=Domibacillus antri TaxID=1714264 RepID=A0A1Q8Q232_9BACI|nr:phage tail tape measure protein [Domibacillus antri]OLN21399.1 phage tail tape measure protein [Domibacillus antri]